MSLTYTISDKTKKTFFAMMGIGILAFVYAFLRGIPAQRIWANLLVDIFFFLALGLGATFYMAMTYLSEASYAIVFKRVYEAISGWVPVGAVMLLLFLLLGFFGVHHIYHWMEKDLYDPASPHFDKVIAGKATYFNPIFYWSRMLVFFGLYIFAQRTLRKYSLEEDLTGDIKLYKKSITTSAWFMVVFGFTSPPLIWDVIMSIDAHWYTTLFAWYIFAGIWCTTMIVITLFTIFIKGEGYLPEVNENHLHDLAKWIFALSILWSYTFFCQFLLIWYANIPEEVAYFQNRLGDFGYMPLFWTMFFINLALPLILFMSRNSKRNRSLVKVICIILLCTHWLDVFVIVMPGTVAGNWGIGPLEIGMFLGFAGVFCYFVLRQLAKAPLLVQKHPFLEESLHHHV